MRKFHQVGTTDSLASEAARLVPGIQVASHYKIKEHFQPGRLKNIGMDIRLGWGFERHF